MIKKIIRLSYIIFFITIPAHALENKIILKISNEIITTLDVYKEINRLKFFNKELNEINKEEINNIALQSIIKTKIKKREIEKYTQLKNYNNDYLNFLIENTYKDLGFTSLGDFRDELKKRKINFEDYKELILIDIFWNQIIYSKYNDKVVVDEKKLLDLIKNQDNSIIEYDLSEIVFQIENNKKIDDLFKMINFEIKNIGFSNTALKYSISSSAKNGGKLGWISENSLSKEISQILKKVDIGSFTKPIRIQSGFLILKKNNTRQIEKNLDENEELKKLIDFEKNKQLNNYSNLYYKKIKQNIKIYAP